MKQISIIGTSEIAKEHIKAILANKTKNIAYLHIVKIKETVCFKKKFRI